MGNSSDPSMFREVPPDALCPSCGEFAGTARRCPQCGAIVRKRLSLVLVRWLAVAVAVLGLAALYMYSRNREVPAARVAELTPTMNFAYLRVVGRVVGNPYIAEGPSGPERINFSVDDGTGVIRITGYRQVLQRMEEQDRVPRAGERVSVAGSVQFTGDEARMLLQVPEHVERFPEETTFVALGEIGEDHRGRTVRTRGTIAAVRAPESGSRAPYRIELVDGDAEMPLVFWKTTFDEIDAPEKLVPGAVLELTAAVQEYRGNPQLQIESGSDLEVAGRSEPRTPALPPPVDDAVRAATIAGLDAGQVGRRVRVEGVVAAVEAQPPDSRIPTRVTLDDAGKTLEVVYWGEVSGALEPDAAPAEGVRLRVTGTVGDYRGKLQLRVEDTADIARTEQTGAVDRAPRATGGAGDVAAAEPIASIARDRSGSRATVLGTVESSRDVRGGRLITIRDASGTMTLPFWERVFPDGLPAVASGDVVRISGEILEYQGRMEVVPETAGDVVRIDPGS